MQNHAAEIKLRAQRRAGEVLAEMERQQGRRTDLETSLEPITKSFTEAIEDAGINKFAAHNWQTIAAMPEEDFERYGDISAQYVPFCPYGL